MFLDRPWMGNRVAGLLANTGARELYCGHPQFLAKPEVVLLGRVKVRQLHQGMKSRHSWALKMGEPSQDTEISLRFREDFQVSWVWVTAGG